MASPNISELATTTIESRRRKLADNVTDNTALLSRMKQRGRVVPISGGETILEELEYDENSTYKRFSGYEVLDISPSDVFTAAEFDLRQVSVAVTISRLEQLKNSGKERMIPLLERRISNAEKTMVNGLSGDLYSEGTADGGKQIDGLGIAVPTDPTRGTYGGINRGTYEFWQSKLVKGATVGSSTNIRAKMMEMWTQTCRGMDKVDLIPADNNLYIAFWSALQDQQRFANARMAQMGFTSIKFISADVVLDGGVGGSATANTMFFLNTDYIRWRPHSDENMNASEDRYATNQAAMVKLILWAGNLTCSNCFLQGRLNTAS